MFIGVKVVERLEATRKKIDTQASHYSTRESAVQTSVVILAMLSILLALDRSERVQKGVRCGV